MLLGLALSRPECPCYDGFMSGEKIKPEWVPQDHDAAHHFTTQVMPGIKGGHGKPEQSVAPMATRSQRKRRRELSVAEYVAGVLACDRVILSRAITLVESSNPEHRERAQDVLSQCLPHSGRSLRIGITGTPGAGKSTFIEALGTQLCRNAHKVAVLAVDPSSKRSGGSILGDKTRMESLTREPNAFIRPSPSGGALGGVAAKTRETLLLCEAAGFDVIIVETVGVGQSEVTVRSMVDFFLVLQIAGGGDELQGIKKGVIELADAIAVNKADGDNQAKALAAKTEYNRVLHYLQPATPGWKSRAVTCSALKGDGIEAIWELFQSYLETTRANGEFDKRRQQQNVYWMHALIEEALLQHFRQASHIRDVLPQTEQAVADGQLPVTRAVLQLLKHYHGDADPQNALNPDGNPVSHT